MEIEIIDLLDVLMKDTICGISFQSCANGKKVESDGVNRRKSKGIAGETGCVDPEMV